jgi:ribonuclease VapC
LIVVDSSALFAILQGEAEAEDCRRVIADARDLLIAAPTLTETLVVSLGRQLHSEMANLIAALDLRVVPLTEALAYAAVRAYRDWGKGINPASLNICDVFAYALAKEHDCPLLFVGDDFALTDVAPALA